MKKYLFIIIVFCLIFQIGQTNNQFINYQDSIYIVVDSANIDSLMGDTISSPIIRPAFRIGLDTTYLKSLIKIDTQKVSFEKGIKLFNAKKYYDALKVFEKIREIQPSRNRYLSAVDMMITKTYLRLGNFEKTIYTGYEFETMHGNSSYLDDVQYTLGDAFMSVGRYSDALAYYISVMKKTSDSRMLDKCRESIDMLVDIFMTLEELEALSDYIRQDKFYDYIISLKLIEKHHVLGNNDEVERSLKKARKKAKSAFFMQEYYRTINKVKNNYGGQKYIGVILPLSGNENYARIGKEILQGVRVSLKRYNKKFAKKISAIVMDNKGEMVQSVMHAKYLATNREVVGIMGPIKSENVIAVATYANEKKIPIISPTAAYSDITELGPWFFQANVNIKNIGEYLGKFATSQKHNANIVSLAPLTGNGENLTDTFTEAVDVNGGRIISQQWYNQSPSQLGGQFHEIRKAGIRLAQEKLSEQIITMRDSLIKLSMQPGSRWNRNNCFLNVDDSVCQLYENGRLREMTIKQVLLYTGLMSSSDFKLPSLDSLDKQISSLDGLFLPGTKAELSMILPNVKYHNLDLKIYGTRNLMDDELRKNNPTLARHFYFISDYYIDENSVRYRQMARDYIKFNGAKPGRYGTYGYDTMEVLMMAYYNSDNTRKDIRKQLMNMPVYRGVGKKISFNGNQPGSNSCAYILSIRRGNIVPIASVENGEIIFCK